jgi:hypothetical protein
VQDKQGRVADGDKSLSQSITAFGSRVADGDKSPTEENVSNTTRGRVWGGFDLAPKS